jgi:hypothetical protein
LGGCQPLSGEINTAVCHRLTRHASPTTKFAGSAALAFRAAYGSENIITIKLFFCSRKLPSIVHISYTHIMV